MDFDKEQYGLGPLEPLLEDPDVLEILINGPKQVYCERNGKMLETDVEFRDNDHLMELIRMLAGPLGRKVDEANPMVDLRLADGTRVNIVVPPIAVTGPAITMRKMNPRSLTVEDLIGYGSWNEQIVDFLRACIQGWLNIVVAGGTGSGKTTVLNCLGNMVPEDDRVIIVQHLNEIQLRHKHMVKLESRPPDAEGRGEVAVRELIANAVKMRPDRIILGECHSGEVLDLLEAMTTGHDGTMCSIHATSPRDALGRLEAMATMHPVSLPLLTIRQKMASGLHLIAQQERMRDGKRKITRITEVTGMTGDSIGTQDIFEFVQTDFKDGRIIGHFTPTGYVPTFVQRLADVGITFPEGFFEPKQ